VWAASKPKGFDVSSQNGEIDWEAVAESGMDFVMIRTGEGQAPDMDAQTV
jgi:GH25 family lysozyme M1 (1,4-beta-N-acetylmuramidase)